MKTINRMMINICSDRFEESKHFYTTLFDFKIDFDSDWFVHFMSEDKQLELAIIDSNSEVVPPLVRNQPAGFYMTFVVDNVDELYETAELENFFIINEPEDTFYGQRRMMLKDPNGAVVDISSPIENFDLEEQR